VTDPVTTIGLGALAAYVGKDGLEKVLGPTAAYLGEGLRDFTQKRAQAIGRIFKSAHDKLGSKVNTPGEVPPKVLRVVVNEGSYASDPLEVEYFGGILASARTEGGRDDRCARLAKAVDGLSTYQLRTHYLIYATVRALFATRSLPFNMDGRPKMRIFVSIEDYAASMAFDQREAKQLGQILSHVFFGLHADNLIEGMWQYGPKDHMAKHWAAAPSDGIICQPSALGAELFLAAHGCADQPLEHIFSPGLPQGPDGLPSRFQNAVATETS
jgi:hypothetical protein